MTAVNFDETLTAFQKRSPFRAFKIVLLSSIRFKIDDPRARVFRNEIAVFVGYGGVPVQL